MFTKKDFEVFQDDTLDGRLQLIREKIDPSFEKMGARLLSALEDEYQSQFYLKIAKHQRRSKNPPPDTWLAISQDKHGYKKNPHVELGLWPDRYFVTFSLLADAYDRAEYYPKFQAIEKQIVQSNWLVSNNHTVANMDNSQKYPDVLKRYMSVKSSDLVIGYNLRADSKIVSQGNYDEVLFDQFMQLSKLMVEFNQK